MGYRDDGNFNFGNKTLSPTDDPRENRYGITEGGKVNSKFMFPDSSIRFLEAEAALELYKNKTTNNLSSGNYKIHRGYIRNLEQPQFGEVPVSRCNFQFNPQEIRQDVSMRSEIYLPLLQKPQELSQPVGGMTNFVFDLLFDRSHEVAAGKRTRVENSGDIYSDVGGDPFSINAQLDPQEIGVMADLRILFSVIGQGFSAEMLNFQMMNYLSNIDISNDRDNPDKEYTPAELKSFEVDIQKVIEANYGNFALLMPNPVRVMFSSLFMLDGFVTGTAVNFLKFNTKMVPLQCRVTMNMQAMYIGFARQKTFLTDVFEKAADSLKRERSQEAAALAELRQALIKTASRFVMAPLWSGVESFTDAWDLVVNKKIESSFKLPLWALAVDDAAAEKPPVGTGQGRALVLGFPNIKPKAGGDETTTTGGTETVVTNKDNDAILTLFENDKPLSISYSWSIKVYGKKDGSIKYQDVAQAYDNNPNPNVPVPAEQIATTYIPNNAYKEQLTLLGSFSGTETASSKDDWGSGASGKGYDNDRVRRKLIAGKPPEQNEKLKNNGDSYKAYLADSVPSSLKNSYFIVEQGITITASLIGGTGQRIVADDSSVKIYKGTSTLYEDFLLNWTTGAGQGKYVMPVIPPQLR